MYVGRGGGGRRDEGYQVLPWMSDPFFYSVFLSVERDYANVFLSNQIATFFTSQSCIVN